MNVAALLEGPASERPNAPAIIEASGIRTFAQLDDRARRIAAMLHASGVTTGDGVLFFEPPSAALYATLAAVLRLGAVAMFVEPSAGMATLRAACDMWPPKVLVASPKAHLLRLVSSALRRIPIKLTSGLATPFTRSLAIANEYEPLRAMAVVADDSPALLTFTSGSTGAPKAAVRTHGILLAQLEALSAELSARPGERDLVALPIVVLLNIARGAETIIPDADLRRPGEIETAPVLAQIREHQPARITASPAFLERLASDGSGQLAGITTILTGGGPVFPDLVQRLTQVAPIARVVSVYGSTEAEPIAHIANDQVTPDDLAAMREGAGLLAGMVDPMARLRIIDATWGEPVPPLTTAAFDGRSLPTAEVGEIVVTGPHVVRGYLGGVGDAETKFRVDGEVWHRTGDLGRLDHEGRLWLLGRASAAISDDRGTLYPFAVECAARSVLNGKKVAVIALGGERLLAIETDAVGFDEADLRRRLSWARLDRVVAVKRIPTDRRHNSKVDYTALARVIR
jgi:olefin beta-lactone synthetase